MPEHRKWRRHVQVNDLNMKDRLVKSTDGSTEHLYITVRNTSCSGTCSRSGPRGREVGRRPGLEPCTDRRGTMAHAWRLGRARAALRPSDGAKSHVALSTVRGLLRGLSALHNTATAGPLVEKDQAAAKPNARRMECDCEGASEISVALALACDGC